MTQATDAIDGIGEYFQKNMVGGRIGFWADQFMGTPMEVEALQLVKERMHITKESEQLYAKEMPYRERERMSRVQRAKYQEKLDKERDAIDKKRKVCDEKENKLTERLIDHRIEQAKKVGKSDAEIAQDIYDTCEAFQKAIPDEPSHDPADPDGPIGMLAMWNEGYDFQKADDGKPGESLGETSSEELTATHKDLAARLKAKPDDKALQARYNAIDAEVRKRGKHKEHEPPEHKTEKALPSEEAKVTPEKARQILHDGEVKGHSLTEQQRKFFGAIGGHLPAPKGKAKKSMDGIDQLGDFLEKGLSNDLKGASQASYQPEEESGIKAPISGDNAAGTGSSDWHGMPHGDTNFNATSDEDGGPLADVGKVHSKTGPAEMPHGASASPGDKLSTDDKPAETQMSPAGPGEFRQGQQTMQGRWMKSDGAGGYTAQELEHTVAHKHALRVQQLQKSDDTVVEGNDPPPPADPDPVEKAQTIRQGDLVAYSNASDLAVEQLEKQSGFYHGAPPRVDATGTLRKSVQCVNGHEMPAALSSCPSCGLQKAGDPVNAQPEGLVLLKTGRGLMPARTEPDLVLPNGTIQDEE